ncbi:carboxylating nicotinate-nucleotide diphosphorylase, partial [Roseisolibacter sp. H3M3-2]|uniref:carboxylating nicotinate-nucleotide diphosphorylase n=1 Tax=Roseisolibacter sp. H3M3-2 TaxID=3031323 RepID=UPI0031F30491
DRRPDLRRERRAADRRVGAAGAESHLSRMMQGAGDAVRDAEADGVAGQVVFGSTGVVPAEPLYFPLTPAQTSLLVREALHEDEAFNDVTTLATVLSGRHARGYLVARQAGVLAGVALAVEAFRQVDPRINVRVDVADGGALTPGMPVLILSGHARGLLSAERVALNFLQRLSGVASLTQKYVQAVAGTRARILDTRKTTPGWRKLEKFAVRAGGGMNHRLDLASAVLIKDNHLAAVDGDVAFAVRRARDLAPDGARVEVECDTLPQVEAALAAGADVVMLDNMTLGAMREAVRLCEGRAITEASGGVRLETVREIAETGVHWISVGALTHSAPALDLALDFE